MAAEITNLRQARKAKARIAKEKRASENRAKFGRSKSEKTITTLEGDRQERTLDAVRRDKPT